MQSLTTAALATDLRRQWVERLDRLLAPRMVTVGEKRGWLSACVRIAASTRWDALARFSQERLVELERTARGAEHTDTLTAMHNLADTLMHQGEWAGARELYEKVLAIRRRVLGEEHTDTLTSMEQLALTLTAVGDLQHVVSLRADYLTLLRRALGSEHQQVQQAALNLAEVALRADNPAMAAETLDSMYGIERAQDRNWLGLRIDAAEQLGQKEHAAQYQRQLLDLLRRETTER